MRLSDTTALITGAARGVGRACAIAFAREGADLVLTDICADLPRCPYPMGTSAQLYTTAERCRREGAAVVTRAADVRSADALDAAVEAGIDRFGAIDVLVNNAGIVAPSGVPVHEIDEEEWGLMLDVDLSGAWRALRAVAPYMLARGGGSIINIASTAGTVGYRHFAGYVAAKHGVIGLTRAAALDYAQHGVRVNAICPGSIRDDEALEGRMLAEIARSLKVPLADHERLFQESQPMNRLIEADDVAGAAVWLAGHESQHVSGAVIPVDGAFTAR